MAVVEFVANTYCARTEVLGGGSASNGGEENHRLLHPDGWCGTEVKVARLMFKKVL